MVFTARRHLASYLPETLALSAHALDVAHATGLVAQMSTLTRNAERVRKRARRDNDGKLELQAISEQRKNAELVAKAQGELKPQSQPGVRHLHLHDLGPAALERLASGRLSPQKSEEGPDTVQ